MKTALVIITLFTLSMFCCCGEVAIQVSHGDLEGNGCVVVVPRLKDLPFVLTVAHVIGKDKWDFDSVQIKDDDGKDVKTSVVAVCQDYDLCLLFAQVPKRCSLDILGPGMKLDDLQLTMYIHKDPKTIPVKLSGPDGWQWKIKCHFELGYSGAPVCLGKGNLLAGLANGGFIKSQNGDVVTAVDPNKGLIIPIPIIRKFLAIAADRIISNVDNGEIVYVTRQMVDEYSPNNPPPVKRQIERKAPMIFDEPTNPFELSK